MQVHTRLKKAYGLSNLTLVHLACLNPNGDVLKHILSVNDELQLFDNLKRKPVHFAACCKSAEPIRLLHKNSADVRDVDGKKTVGYQKEDVIQLIKLMKA